MRILLVGINYAPDLIGVAKYNTELCESLAAAGHEVRVVMTAGAQKFITPLTFSSLTAHRTYW